METETAEPEATTKKSLKLFYVKPFSRAMTLTRTKRIICSIWFVSAIVAAGPFFKFGHYSFGATTLTCGMGFPKEEVDKLSLLILVVIADIC